MPFEPRHPSARPTADCLAIVPALDEEASVAEVVRELRSLPGIDVLVVDDGSSDRTAEMARAAGARVASMPFNVGIGGAVQTGYMWALEHGYAVAVQVDGDGQHPAAEVQALVDAIRHGDADLVIGSRFLGGGSYRAPFARRVGIRLFSAIVSTIVRVRVTDTTSGFRAAGTEAIALFARAYPHDYPEVETVLVAHRAGLRVHELPVEMRLRQGGASSITPFRAAYYMVKVLLAIGVETLRRPEASALRQ
jgi:glycosyltransferase involved in cell wall biosynthesis